MIPRYHKWRIKKTHEGKWAVAAPFWTVFGPSVFSAWGEAVAYLSRTLSHYQYKGGTWWHI